MGRGLRPISHGLSSGSRSEQNANHEVQAKFLKREIGRISRSFICGVRLLLRKTFLIVKQQVRSRTSSRESYRQSRVQKCRDGVTTRCATSHGVSVKRHHSDKHCCRERRCNETRSEARLSRQHALLHGEGGTSSSSDIGTTPGIVPGEASNMPLLLAGCIVACT